MAKGRKLTFSLSERYLGSYNNSYDSITSGTVDSDGPELGEEDVWSTIDNGREDPGENGLGNDDLYRDWSSREGSSMARHCSVQNGGGGDGGDRRRMKDGGLSLAFRDLRIGADPRIVHQFMGNEGAPSPRGGKTACSAPVNVPDWSKIYRVDSVESMHGCSDEGEREEEMVPPHEYLARSRRIAAESVFEGVGRTLKGREMRRVRDAVWSQTGFDG